MNIPLLFETVVHLRPSQLFYQMKNRLWKPKLGSNTSTAATYGLMIADTITKARCYEGDLKFSFLNITSDFENWNMNGNGPLWAYNLNYMDWLEQEGISNEECVKWIDKFIDELPENHIGLDPYPIALRIINWAKFFSKHPECKSKRRNDSMYAQTLLLERKLEYHLLGNHLLEDAYALFIAALYFADNRLYGKALKLLIDQLKEQTLPDGAHFEQSPMYHCIMLDRLLDCINFAKASSIVLPLHSPFTPPSLLESYAQLMLGHLASIVYKDGSIPLFNDTAFGIAPMPEALFNYATRLGITLTAVPLRECGYRRLVEGGMEATVDVGNIMADYQPGHSHADTFSYELRMNGHPIVVDTGISTYNKNERRQYERSTAAHNTVTLNSKTPDSKCLDSSHVWGGFRMGRRANVTLVKDEENNVVAYHDGFGRIAVHERLFLLKDGVFRVEDRVPGPAVSWVHLRPGLHAEIVSGKDGLVKISPLPGQLDGIGNLRPFEIKVEDCQCIQLCENTVSIEYNRLQPCQVLAFHFTNSFTYIIR